MRNAVICAVIGEGTSRDAVARSMKLKKTTVNSIIRQFRKTGALTLFVAVELVKASKNTMLSDCVLSLKIICVVIPIFRWKKEIHTTRIFRFVNVCWMISCMIHPCIRPSNGLVLSRVKLG